MKKYEHKKIMLTTYAFFLRVQYTLYYAYIMLQKTSNTLKCKTPVPPKIFQEAPILNIGSNCIP